MTPLDLTAAEFQLWQASRCLQCGAEYDPTNPARIYCGDGCRQRMHRERFRAFADNWDNTRAPREAICTDCAATFAASPRGVLPKRCPPCKKAAHAAYQRDRYRAQLDQ